MVCSRFLLEFCVVNYAVGQCVAGCELLGNRLFGFAQTLDSDAVQNVRVGPGDDGDGIVPGQVRRLGEDADKYMLAGVGFDRSKQLVGIDVKHDVYLSFRLG